MKGATRKAINEYISHAIGDWARGYSVECHRDNDNWDGSTIPLTVMRKVAQPGELWFLDRYHASRCFKDNDDMVEITILGNES